MSARKPLQDQVRALTFDVFGTVVDWRSTVEGELRSEVGKKVDSPGFSSLPAELQDRARGLTDADLAAFAQDWRSAYGVFTRSFVPGETPWKDIDTHHHDSLVELLGARGLAGLFSDGEVRALSLVWHRLRPWPDSAEGIRALGGRFVTVTLSNGNHALLRDLDEHGGLGFRRLISAEDFRAYKPTPAVYRGAVEALGLQPGEVAMVAAHLYDLQAARGCGLRTIYIERPGEEAWGQDEERYQAAKQWVDLWVKEDEGGLVEVARRLGLA